MGSLRIDHSSSALSPVLGALLDSTDLHDVRLCLDDDEGPILAHRCVLAAWSQPFRAMFTNGMRETAAQDVVLHDVDRPALVALLCYCYTGKAVLQSHDVLPLLAVANRFGVIQLKARCEQHACELISTSNCCELCLAAERHSCQRLREVCLEFVVKHFEKVSLTIGFGLLSVGVMEDVLRRDDLAVRSEESVFDAVLRWNHHESPPMQVGSDTIGSSPRTVIPLLDHVRFPLMSSEYLSNVVEQSDVASNSDKMNELLFEAYRYHAVGATLGGLPKERGRETVLFGEDEVGGLVGRIEAYSSSLSASHDIGNIHRRDDSYWLPSSANEAFVCCALGRPYRITSIVLQNRHSWKFAVYVEEFGEGLVGVGGGASAAASSSGSGALMGVTTSGSGTGIVQGGTGRRSQWREVVGPMLSGDIKAERVLDLSDHIVVGERVRLVLYGRPHSTHNPSVFWVQIRGKPVRGMGCTQSPEQLASEFLP